ncbi:MAG: hypothetical protein ACI86M_002725 [Saprospiraceae bacterium]|jgi:hypothetical protein
MHSLEKLIQRNKEELSNFLPSYSPITQSKKSTSQKTWKEYSDNCPPGTFMIMHNLITREVIHMHNVAQMGCDINHVTDIIQSTHENHTPFLMHNMTCLLLTIYKYHNGDPNLMNIYATSLRSLKNNKNEYQQLKLTSLPITRDTYNNPIEYITWYTPIEPYDGQPYQVRLIPIKYDARNEAIISTYQSLRKDSFSYLKFTKRQEEVLLLIKDGLNKHQISEELQIAIRTVEKYNEQILNNGKSLFSLNSFKTSKDVALYLSKMNILPKKKQNTK